MEFQAEIIKFIQSFSSPSLDYFFIFITNLGGEGFYFLFIPIFYWSKNKKLGIQLGAALLLSMYLNALFKEITAIPRPIGYPGIRSIYTCSAGGYSFPSGHAQGNTTAWGIIMAHYKKNPVNLLGIAMIFMVSLSRLYLGVHWPQDIAGGIILGLIIALVATNAYRFRFPGSVAVKYLMAVAVPMALLVIFPHPDTFKYMSMLSAAWLGYILEDQFIGFEPEHEGLLKTAIKYFIGAVGFLLIYVGMKKILPAGNISVMVRYFFLGLWLTAGAPYIFKRL